MIQFVFSKKKGDKTIKLSPDTSLAMKTELKKEKGPKGPKELFYSIYPFTSNSSNEIDLTSIDCPFHILTKPRHGWVKICKADDSEICGYAPFDYLAPETSLYRIPFFHGTMTRQESVSLMKLERPETILFLIRKSSLKGYYALDILEPTGCLKYFVIAIEHDEDNKILYKYSVKNVVHVFYKIEDIVNLIYNRATNPQPIRRLPPKLPGIGICLEDVEIKMSDVNIGDCIGMGEFGKVFVGKLKGKKVAIKMLKSMDSSIQEREFKSELQVMIGLYHKNITSLIGVISNEKQMALITQFAEKGSLRDLLIRRNQEDPEKYFKEERLLQFGLDIARGMAYLHSSQVLHIDLAARNVLVDSDWTCKVSDFGLSKRLSSPNDTILHSKDVKIPLRQMPPEFFTNRQLSKEVDIWAYGITLIEVFNSGEQPYAKQTQNAMIIANIRQGILHERPERMSLELYENICQMCFAMDPVDRKSFSHIIEMIITVGNLD